MFCPNCGKDVADSKFCPSCGNLIPKETEVNLNQATEPTADPEQTVASTVEPEKEKESTSPESESVSAVSESVSAQADFESDIVAVPTTPKESSKFKSMPKGKKALIVVAAAVGILAIIALIFALVKSANSLTVPSECDEGAVFNVTLEQFNENFDKLFKEWSGEEFTIADKWGNVVPTQTDIQSNSGKEFKTYSVVLQSSGMIIGVTEIDGRISSAEVTISQEFIEENRLSWLEMNYMVIAACTGISPEEFENIRQIINEGVTASYYSVVVKDSVLYNFETFRTDYGLNMAYSATAVSDKFIKKLEDNGGNCRVVYYDEKTKGQEGFDSVNTAQTEVKTQINKQAAVEALYSISAYPYGLEQAVELGIYKDISVGDALERMFNNPTVECRADDDGNVLVTVSGQYRASPTDSNYLYSGSITYRVFPDGNVRLKSDPDDVKQMMEYFAVTLGKR